MSVPSAISNAAVLLQNRCSKTPQKASLSPVGAGLVSPGDLTWFTSAFGAGRSHGMSEACDFTQITFHGEAEYGWAVGPVTQCHHLDAATHNNIKSGRTQASE